MARRLVAGLTALKGVQLLYKVDANEIFVVLPVQIHDALQAAGAQYIPGRPTGRANAPSGWSRPSTPIKLPSTSSWPSPGIAQLQVTSGERHMPDLKPGLKAEIVHDRR